MDRRSKQSDPALPNSRDETKRKRLIDGLHAHGITTGWEAAA
ncbi:MAG: hypothetical protein AAGB11_02875 [Pseudomonadota bacterium]